MRERRVSKLFAWFGGVRRAAARVWNAPVAVPANPIGPFAVFPPHRASRPTAPVDAVAEAEAVLRSLGYTPADAHAAVARLSPDPALSVEDRVAAALKLLAEP